MKNKNGVIFPIISTAITLLSSACVGVALMFSEILYPEIEELSACPLWYRIFLLVSLGVAFVGMIFTAISKKTKNAKLILFYKKERRMEFILTIGGFWLLIVAGLKEENRVGDIVLCLGGALCALGLFALLGTSIGLANSAKKNKYIDLICQFMKVNPIIKLTEPAQMTDLLAFESEIGCMLPKELTDFYLETDGDGDLMFSVDEANKTTKLVREGFAEFNPLVENIVCFGGNGAGDYYCYLVREGNVIDGEIYTFYHETNELSLSAESLPGLISLYYNGFLY